MYLEINTVCANLMLIKRLILWMVLLASTLLLHVVKKGGFKFSISKISNFCLSTKFGMTVVHYLIMCFLLFETCRH